MSEDEETLDMSWIDEQERIINNDYYREPVSSVRLITLYINQNDYINEIKKERIELTKEGQGHCPEAKGQGQCPQAKGQGHCPEEEEGKKEGSLFTQEKLLYIIEKNKRKTEFSKYTLTDILVYNIDLEPEHIQDFSQYTDEELNTYSKRFLTKASPYVNMNIGASMLPFHKINTIYFIYKETPIFKKSYVLESAMKEPVTKTMEVIPTKKKTKGVQWFGAVRKTRKA